MSYVRYKCAMASSSGGRKEMAGAGGSGRARRLRPSGGYRKSVSFQTATLIYDATYFFCEKFLDRRSRLIDQMVQAARSGRQNIAEASRAAATSSQTELRLMNVARASLEELLLDFEDYLRQRRLPQWEADSPEARAVRGVPHRFRRDRTDRTDRAGLADLTDQERWALYARWLEHKDAAVRANAITCLIHQASFLLDQEIAALERDFIEQGGYSEQLAAARLAHRTTGQGRTERSTPANRDASSPCCPTCGELMVLRTARSGRNAGRQFWGCSAYPTCKGVVPV